MPLIRNRAAHVRRAVVTGGAGFLGSHLCGKLLEEGVEVLCLDNFLTGTPRNVEHLLSEPGFRCLRYDVTDFVHVSGPVDLVLHLASPASPVDYLRFPVETLNVGSIGTWHALGLAREKQARFLLASTSEVYGDPQVHPQPESYWGHVNPVGPRGVYDEAKRYAEAMTTAYRTARGVDTAIVRIFNTFGPRMRPDDGRAVPTFVRQALAGEPITVTGDGLQTRSVCYVDDLVRGILALALSGEPGPVNIGNPHEMTVARIAEDVIRACGSSSTVRFVDRPVDDPQVRRPDTALARERLGWEPRVSWEDGLARTVAWFRDALAAPAGPELTVVR
ncbi:SDR family oxidoreductase [Kineosporia sp. J2-2]|uniref:SDR family oxidoreductase n=1 Tax=Kineosporia corallincola TaxID=2835133 RepID=A0ABS5TF02_9ACTN|nr:UDP-glucuronic acid decarboxylase family protein [Kineosporia corallincola]MBT0769637.1 SDR family oxidoreductase [Kineosporia corallincola]